MAAPLDPVAALVPTSRHLTPQHWQNKRRSGSRLRHLPVNYLHAESNFSAQRPRSCLFRPTNFVESPRACRSCPARSPSRAPTNFCCRKRAYDWIVPVRRCSSNSVRYGEPARVSDLAELLGVDTPTVTRKVQQLERLGYVAIEPDAEDKRAKRVSSDEVRREDHRTDHGRGQSSPLSPLRGLDQGRSDGLLNVTGQVRTRLNE